MPTFGQFTEKLDSGDSNQYGSVVAAPPIDVFIPDSIPSTLSAPQIQVPIRVDDITTLGVFAFQFKVNYDPARIHPLGSNFGCTTVGTLAGDAGLGATCNVTTVGTVRVAVSGVSGMIGSGPVLIVKFAPNPGANIAGDITPLSVTSSLFFNASGQVANITTAGSILFGPDAPVSAGVSVSGIVSDANHNPISRAEVLITDSNGFVRRVITSPFGYFKFDDVPAGATFVMSAASKRYTFQPIIVTTNSEVTGLNLIGVPD